MTTMRILMCGGRDFHDRQMVEDVFFDIAYGVLDADAEYVQEVVIVHGGARGADTLAGEVAEQFGLPVEVYPADWEHCAPECNPNHRRSGRYGEYCPTAGHRRNQQMLDTGIDMVVAFPGGRGTADMVRRATRAGVQVVHAAAERVGPR